MAKRPKWIIALWIVAITYGTYIHTVPTPPCLVLYQGHKPVRLPTYLMPFSSMMPLSWRMKWPEMVHKLSFGMTDWI